MRITFLGANRQVTGSRSLVEACGVRVLVDCGLFQERDEQHRNWDPFSVDPASIDHVVLTHAHLDHCGLLPRLVRDGFAGPIHMTPPSTDLARIVLEDAGRIQEEDASYKRKRHKREGRKGKHPDVPLYTAEDAVACFDRFRPAPLGRDVPLAEGLTFRFIESGHILGSASVLLTADEGAGGARRLLFSGDVGQWNRPLLQDPGGTGRADAVVLESTYGDREHFQYAPGDGVGERLATVINETTQRGGNVIVPTFAIDRAQELMFHLAHLVRTDRIPRLTVFLDSPMAISVTKVYKRYRHLLDDETEALYQRGAHPFQFPGLHFVRGAEESRAINSIRGSCVVLAGSGMCTGGRVKHHLRHNIDREESTVLFVGFQALGTLGRQIVDGAKSVRIHNRTYPVRAAIERLEGLSAHADRADLLRWLAQLDEPPTHVYLNHGEKNAAESFAKAITTELGWPVEVPAFEDSFEV